MCGICGKLSFDPSAEVDPRLLGTMLATISHRGPDDEGIYTDRQVGLGHRRLSIIGLDTGHQPLSNEDGTVWITFNGEIYNYQELRTYLLAQGHRFSTDTDTEVIVHLYEEFGTDAIEHLRGMFAFALWDKRKNILLLARDRVGIKPLYYCLSKDSITFSSELKAILADPEVRAEVDPMMIDRFLTFFYLPGEETLLRNIRKLEPGSYMVVESGKATVRRYWDLTFEPSRLTLKQAEEQLRGILEESVRLHMISDVPVGVLLSGGLDSTAILALARAQTNAPISSYTLGFSDPHIDDERPYARLAAQKFGATHHELTITAADFQQFLPKYVWHMEEPVCEPPAVALYFVSRLASNHVKVLLSGEGGDEAFAGYPNYRNLLWLERLKRGVAPLNGFVGSSLDTLRRLGTSATIDKYTSFFGIPMDNYYYSRTSHPFTFFNSQWPELYSPSFAATANKSDVSLRPLNHLAARAPTTDVVNRLLYIDTMTWLPDDLLIKADKITMANSVELRVPLLDHRLLEFCASLPGSYKVKRFTTKYIAKRVLRNCVPKEISNRKKAGFPVPYASWLRTTMKDWVRETLLDSRAYTQSYFSKTAVERLLAENISTQSYAKEVFSLLVLELWHREFLGRARA